jgi:hypothetical protein
LIPPFISLQKNFEYDNQKKHQSLNQKNLIHQITTSLNNTNA